MFWFTTFCKYMGGGWCGQRVPGFHLQQAFLALPATTACTHTMTHGLPVFWREGWGTPAMCVCVCATAFLPACCPTLFTLTPAYQACDHHLFLARPLQHARQCPGIQPAFLLLIPHLIINYLWWRGGVGIYHGARIIYLHALPLPHLPY